MSRPKWIFPQEHVDSLVQLRSEAERLGSDCLSMILRSTGGQAEIVNRRDARYLYFVRASNLALGLLTIVAALRETVNEPDFLGVEEGHDALTEMKRHMNNRVMPILFWGTMLSWWGNYEHAVQSICGAMGWPVKGKPGLHRLEDIGDAIAPRSGSDHVQGRGSTWRAHWDMASTIRNLIHNGGVFNPTFGPKTLTYGSHAVEFQPKKIPKIPDPLYFQLFRDSIDHWASLALQPDVASLTVEVPDLHCGALDP